MSDNKIIEALDGKLQGQELSDFESSLSEIQKKEYEAAKASRKRRQEEDAKYEKIKKDREEAENRSRIEAESRQRARKEQVDAAKSKFLTDHKITDVNEIASIESVFSKLDSGKSTLEDIYKDFESTYASLHKDDFLKLRREKQDMEKNAFDINARRGGDGAPPAQPPIDKKYDPHAEEYAKKWGISLDQAQASIDRQKADGSAKGWRSLS